MRFVLRNVDGAAAGARERRLPRHRPGPLRRRPRGRRHRHAPQRRRSSRTPARSSTKCPSKYAAGQEARRKWPRSVARRCSSASGSSSTRSSPARSRRGSAAAGSPLSAQNALLASFATTLVAAGVLWAALARHDFSFVYVARAHEPRAAARLRALGVLGRPGGIAAALAAHPHRLRGARRLAEPAHARAHRVGRAGARRRRDASSRSCSASSRARSTTRARARRRRRAWCRACRTRTCSRTRRCSTSATSG